MEMKAAGQPWGRLQSADRLQPVSGAFCGAEACPTTRAVIFACAVCVLCASRELLYDFEIGCLAGRRALLRGILIDDGYLQRVVARRQLLSQAKVIVRHQSLHVGLVFRIDCHRSTCPQILSVVIQCGA